MTAFCQMGTSEIVSPQVAAVLEEFVCAMYGVHNETNVNNARFIIFKNLYSQKMMKVQ